MSSARPLYSFVPLLLLLSLYGVIAFPSSVFAQSDATIPPKREVRAVWIATVENIDWPNPNHNRKQQKEKLINIVDSMHQLGMNTIFFQVRPSSDAFYRSSKEPWSEWLMGKQGKGAWYDPLKLMLNACHERGMELHAWFNPFRVVHHGSLGKKKHSKHLTQTHPEWIIKYGKGAVVNPGIPEARDYIISVISEVVEKYDIDGVHLDDYFYPYPKPNMPFPDSLTFKAYGRGFSDIGDWRRDNVNQLIQDLSENIELIKPYVKFGVSPFGVWRNQSNDSLGSNTWAGMPSYDSIYADSRKWMEERWIDYLVPQLYWSIKFKAAGFGELLPWWVNNSFDRHLYIGHAIYKIQNNYDTQWNNPEEMPKQVAMVREYRPTALGSAFFRAGFILKNPGNIQEKLKALYTTVALPPLMPWKKGAAVGPPSSTRVNSNKNGKIVIRWKAPAGKEPRYYLIYKYPKSQAFNPENPSQLYQIVQGKHTHWLDPTGSNEYNYRVSSIDRLWREALPSD